MIHEDAVDLIAYYEGCDNVAKACPSHVSKGGKWPHLTIGYGHSGPDVREGMRITTAQARDLLARDLANTETMVRELVKVKLNDTQFGAVCALVYNLKPGRFRVSKTLVKMNAEEFGTFDMASAYATPIGSGLSGMAFEWAEFRNFEKDDGSLQPLLGLIRRRASELELFFTGRWSVPSDLKLPSQPAAVASDPAPNALQPGMRDEIIADLHDALGAAGYPVTCGDAYTWVTVEAVRAFQKAHGISPTGIYDADTADTLAKALNARAGR
jgi:lysozyme